MEPLRVATLFSMVLNVLAVLAIYLLSEGVFDMGQNGIRNENNSQV